MTPKAHFGGLSLNWSWSGTKLEKKAIRSIGYNGQKKKGWRCVDPTTNKANVSPHLVFDEASSWWSTENVVLPDSESLDTSMRAQLPERQEVSVGSDSKPVESLEFTNWQFFEPHMIEDRCSRGSKFQSP